jgi:hypothetical protein
MLKGIINMAIFCKNDPCFILLPKIMSKSIIPLSIYIDFILEKYGYRIVCRTGTIINNNAKTIGINLNKIFS